VDHKELGLFLAYLMVEGATRTVFQLFCVSSLNFSPAQSACYQPATTTPEPAVIFAVKSIVDGGWADSKLDDIRSSRFPATFLYFPAIELQRSILSLKCNMAKYAMLIVFIGSYWSYLNAQLVCTLLH